MGDHYEDSQFSGPLHSPQSDDTGGGPENREQRTENREQRTEIGDRGFQILGCRWDAGKLVGIIIWMFFSGLSTRPFGKGPRWVRGTEWINE